MDGYLWHMLFEVEPPRTVDIDMAHAAHFFHLDSEAWTRFFLEDGGMHWKKRCPQHFGTFPSGSLGNIGSDLRVNLVGFWSPGRITPAKGYLKNKQGFVALLAAALPRTRR